MTCSDFCTAAKCAELERRINSLEAVVIYLQQQIDTHKSSEIPYAHRYYPTVSLTGNYSNATHDLNLRVQVDNAADFVSIDVDPHTKSNLKLNGSYESETLTLTVADGESQDTATISIPKLDPEVTVDVFELDNGQFAVKVSVNEASGEDTFAIPPSNLQLDGSYQSETLTITVADGVSQDTATINVAGINGKDGQDGRDGQDGERGLRGFSGADGNSLLDAAALLAALLSIKDALKDIIRELLSELINQLVQELFDLLADLLLDKLQRNLSLQLLYQSGDLTANISLNGASASDTTKIDMELVSIEIEQVTCTAGKLEIKPLTVAVLKGTEAAELEKYANQAAMLKSQCELDAVAVVPEWWQSRIGSDRPQLIIIYEDADNSAWSLSLPWYKGGFGSKIIDLIPSYTKGNFNTTLTLADNSKIVVNASSKTEGEIYIKRVQQLINPELLKGAELKSGGERKGKIKRANVTPLAAKFFSTGQKDMLPDWKYSFKNKKYFKYEREEE